jgi:hypothetical protein
MASTLDLAKRFTNYIETKRVAGGGSSHDLTTAVMADYPTVRSNASAKKADVNTDYYLVIT